MSSKDKKDKKEKKEKQPKQEIDEQIVEEEEPVDISLETVVEPALRGAYKYLGWKDIQNLERVCRGWRSAMVNEVADEPAYLVKYQEAFPDRAEADNKYYSWRAQKTVAAMDQCFLVLLENQMLLRELASYHVNKPKSDTEGRGFYETVREQITKFPLGDQDEQDLLQRIAELRIIMMKGYQHNNDLEKKHKVLEHKIGLLISHKCNIIEMDRKKKGQNRQVAAGAKGDRPAFASNKTKMEHYSNLFYLLRTEPHYLAKIAFLLEGGRPEKAHFSDTCILTMYANAFSHLEELLLLDILTATVSLEVENSSSAKAFTQGETTGLFMIISYNRRKEGKSYIQKNFEKPIKEILKEESSIVENTDKVLEWCDKLATIILDSSLPYGLCWLCNQVSSLLKKKYPDTKEVDILRAVGFIVFYRFIALVLVEPDKWGIIETDDFRGFGPHNLAQIAKVLKSLFTDLQPFDDKKLTAYNSWINKKMPAVTEFLKQVTDVATPEEQLRVSRYTHLGKKEKDAIVIQLKDIVFIHALCHKNQKELVDKNNPAEDPLSKILKDLEEVPVCPDTDTNEVTLELSNRFPPKLSKMDKKKNLKSETIDAAIKVMQKLPGFTGNTFLEVFVRMKLHLKKMGEAELAEEVHNVIANLQNLAKYGLISSDDGYNGFLVDIQQELVARTRRRSEQMKEIERLNATIADLKDQEVDLDKKIKEFEDYLGAIRKKLTENFTAKTKVFKYSQLTKKENNLVKSSIVSDSQAGKVKFTITQAAIEEFHVKGTIKGLPLFKREFKIDLGTLLEYKEDGIQVFDTQEGMELNVGPTLVFLNKNFYKPSKK